MNNNDYFIFNKTSGYLTMETDNNICRIFNAIYVACLDFLEDCDNWTSEDCPQIDKATKENQALWLAANILKEKNGGDICDIFRGERIL